MFARSFVNSAKTMRGVRFNSTKTSAINGLVQRLTGLGNCAVYWAKVSGEVAKQVYLKEGLAPPSVSQFETVYKSLYKQALGLLSNPQAATKGLSFTKENVYKYGAYGIQVVGLFSLGEIVGRRQIIGYPSYQSHSH